MQDLEKKIQSLEISRSSPFTLEELDKLESQFEREVPEDLRWFMLNYGKCLFRRAISFPFIASRDIQEFMAIPNVLPRGVLPFTEDDFTNAHCISLRDATYGNVYYWRHDAGWDQSSEDQDEELFKCTLKLVASSFSDFFLSIPRADKY